MSEYPCLPCNVIIGNSHLDVALGYTSVEKAQSTIKQGGTALFYMRYLTISSRLDDLLCYEYSKPSAASARVILPLMSRCIASFFGKSTAVLKKETGTLQTD
jgi:hypothetical protein